MDNGDKAALAAQAHLEKALARRPRGGVVASALECRRCGDPIPEGRRRAVPGVQLCVACAETRKRA